MTAQVIGRRERKKQAVRDSIQDELFRLIGLNGLEGTTIDELCEAADISKKTFYNYYSTRHDLIMEVCQSRLFNHLQNNITVTIENYRGLSDQLIFLMGKMEQFILHAKRSEKELINYMLMNLSSNNGSKQSHSMQEGYEQIFRAGAAELKSGLTPEFCAEMTVAMVNALSLSLISNNKAGSKGKVQAKTKMLLTYILQSMLK